MDLSSFLLGLIAGVVSMLALAYWLGGKKSREKPTTDLLVSGPGRIPLQPAPKEKWDQPCSLCPQNALWIERETGKRLCYDHLIATASRA